VHAPTNNKSDEMRDSFYNELEHVFHQFPNNHMNILLEISMKKKGGRYFETNYQE
jgi:hypothetical protein